MNRRSPLAALLLVALAGCGEEDRTQTSYTPSADRTATSSDDLPPRLLPVTPVPPDTTIPPPPPAVVDVVAVPPAGGGPAARARLASTRGGAVTVTTRLSAGMPSATYAGAVHQGACAGIGPRVASLVPVTADSLGAGASSSDLPLPLDSLTRSPHVLVLGRGGRPEACGEIGR